jgi:hypothetical protein
VAVGFNRYSHRVVALILAVGVGASSLLVGAERSSATRSCTEPWAVCSPDARWLRTVLIRTGHRRVDQDGAALITSFPVGGSWQYRFYWATSGGPPARPYRRLYRVRGTSIFGDGVRIVWSAQEARIWVEPPPARTVVARLVAATIAVPRPR